MQRKRKNEHFITFSVILLFSLFSYICLEVEICWDFSFFNTIFGKNWNEKSLHLLAYYAQFFSLGVLSKIKTMTCWHVLCFPDKDCKKKRHNLKGAKYNHHNWHPLFWRNEDMSALSNRLRTNVLLHVVPVNMRQNPIMACT